MAQHKQVVSNPTFKTRRGYVPVALATASLLSEVLKIRVETANNYVICNMFIAIIFNLLVANQAGLVSVKGLREIAAVL